MTGFEGTTISLETLPIAFYSGLWAYDGWYDYYLLKFKAFLNVII